MGKRDTGANAHGHYHDPRRDAAAVLKLQAFDMVFPEHGGAFTFHEKTNAACLHCLLQHSAAPRIQLLVQGPGTTMHYGYPHAAGIQAMGDLQTEQASTDDDCLSALCTDSGQRLHIAHIAIAVYAREIVAGDGCQSGGRPGCDQNAIVGNVFTASRDYPPPHPIDLDYWAAGMQGDAMFRIPIMIIEDGLLEAHLAG